MPFVPFASYFQELAQNETRSILQLEAGAQKCAHHFVELFCDEVGCDCRRVIVQVISDEPGATQPRATLTWGWEPDVFYHAWASFPLDADDLEELRGPGFMRFSMQSSDAPELLRQFRMLLEQRSYAARIVRHYELFRARIEEEGACAPGGAATSMNRAERRRQKAQQRRRR